jgi:hypothetical protein
MPSADAQLSSLPQACLSPESIKCQLEHHVGVLRVLCEELTSPEDQQELKRALRDYEQKIARLLKCASEIHTTLQSSQGGALEERSVLCKKSCASEQARRNFAQSNDICMIMGFFFLGSIFTPFYFNNAIVIPS